MTGRVIVRRLARDLDEENESPDLEEVSMTDRGPVDRLIVDSCPVEAVKIINIPFPTLETQATMATTDIGEG